MNMARVYEYFFLSLQLTQLTQDLPSSALNVEMNFYQKYSGNSLPIMVHILLCIFALAFWLFVASIILPFLFVFNVFKWSVAAWIVYNRVGKVVNSEDAPYMHESEHNKNYNVCLFMVKGEPDVEKLRKLFDDRVVANDGHPSYQRLKKRIQRKYGRYVWSNEIDFDISRHIVKYEGTPPANSEELEKLFGEIISKPLAEDMSPWQVVLVPLQAENKFAFFTRAHHIIGDGISMVNLFSKCMDDKPVLLKPSEKLIKKYKSSALKRVLHGIFTGPLVLLSIALSSSNKPFARTTDKEGEQKVAWTEAISLPKIKEVKSKIGIFVIQS